MFFFKKHKLLLYAVRLTAVRYKIPLENSSLKVKNKGKPKNIPVMVATHKIPISRQEWGMIETYYVKNGWGF